MNGGSEEIPVMFEFLQNFWKLTQVPKNKWFNYGLQYIYIVYIWFNYGLTMVFKWFNYGLSIVNSCFIVVKLIENATIEIRGLVDAPKELKIYLP